MGDESERLLELKQEKERLQVAKLQYDSGLISDREVTLAVERMEWMYNAKGQADEQQEAFRLGMEIPNTDPEILEPPPDPTASLFLKSLTKTDADTLRKIREDPLFVIQQAQEQQRRAKQAESSVRQRLREIAGEGGAVAKKQSNDKPLPKAKTSPPITTNKNTTKAPYHKSAPQRHTADNNVTSTAPPALGRFEYRSDVRRNEHSSDVRRNEHSSDVRRNEHSSDVRRNEHSSDVRRNEHGSDGRRNEHGSDGRRNEHGSDGRRHCRVEVQQYRRQRRQKSDSSSSSSSSSASPRRDDRRSRRSSNRKECKELCDGHHSSRHRRPVESSLSPSRRVDRYGRRTRRQRDKSDEELSSSRRRSEKRHRAQQDSDDDLERRRRRQLRSGSPQRAAAAAGGGRGRGRAESNYIMRSDDRREDRTVEPVSRRAAAAAADIRDTTAGIEPMSCTPSGEKHTRQDVEAAPEAEATQRAKRGAARPEDFTHRTQKFEEENLGPPAPMLKKLQAELHVENMTSAVTPIDTELQAAGGVKSKQEILQEMLERGKRHETDKDERHLKQEAKERRLELMETIMKKRKGGGQQDFENGLTGSVYRKTSENLCERLRVVAARGGANVRRQLEDDSLV